MDKYQKFILEQAFKLNDDVRNCGKYHYQSSGFVSEKTGRKDCGTFDFERDTITIVQDEDIYSTRYKHTVQDYYDESVSKDVKRGRAMSNESSDTFSVKYLSGVSISTDGSTWQALPDKLAESEGEHRSEYELILNFSAPITKVKFSFVNNIADDYVMDVIYVEADKKEFNRKKAAEERLRLIKAANVKCETGSDLVNIYFGPCNDAYSRTAIVLYKDGRMLAKHDVEQDRYYFALNNLAYGDYSFVLSQYAKDGSLIFETDRLVFRIVKPHQGRPPM